MAEHPGDALHRYDHARADLATIDRQIQNYDLQGHAVHGNLIDSDRIATLIMLLRDQAQASEAFTAAAAGLADALGKERAA